MAASVAEELRQTFGVEANLVPGKDGIFDVMVDGKPVFSRFETGRFPKPGEITRRLKP